MTEFIWRTESWDEGEEVITVRPDWEKSSNAVPIGATLSPKDARIVARWLHFSYRNLRTLFYNEFKDKD